MSPARVTSEAGSKTLPQRRLARTSGLKGIRRHARTRAIPQALACARWGLRELYRAAKQAAEMSSGRWRRRLLERADERAATVAEFERAVGDEHVLNVER